MSARKAPSFFVVGAAKAGTTALAEYLDLHPEVYMCPIKEPHHFSKDIRIDDFDPAYRREHQDFDIKRYLASPCLEKRHIEFIADLEDYLQLFREMEQEQTAGEASTGYLYSEVAAEEISQTFPDAKIIMFLRNPVDRAYSHYRMDLALGNVSGSFIEALERDAKTSHKGWGLTHLYRELGLYHDQVSRYLRRFPREQVSIQIYCKWLANNRAVLDHLAGFLDLSPFPDSGGMLVRNQSAGEPVHAGLVRFLRSSGLKDIGRKMLSDGVRRKFKKLVYRDNATALSPEDRARAYLFFKEDIARLEDLIQVDLKRWKV